MNNIKTAPFKFINFSIIDSSIKRKDNSTNIKKLNFKISPSGKIDETNKIFELQLKVEIVDSTKQFRTKVIIVGYFEFKEVTTLEFLDNYFYINAPAIIFPYVRAYIASLTALSGFETINLPPINIGTLKEELIENTVKIETIE